MAIVGGTASAIGGGKFSNGAMGSAFQYLFNDALGWGDYKDPNKVAFGSDVDDFSFFDDTATGRVLKDLFGDIPKAFQGFADGLNRLNELNTSSMSPVEKKTFQFLQLKYQTILSYTETPINGVGIVEDYNDGKSMYNSVTE